MTFCARDLVEFSHTLQTNTQIKMFTRDILKLCFTRMEQYYYGSHFGNPFKLNIWNSFLNV